LNSTPENPPPDERGKYKGLFVVQKLPPPEPQFKVKTYTASGLTVIQSEFADQLEALTVQYFEQYKPAGMTETMLVRDLASSQTRADYAVRLQNQTGVKFDAKTLATLHRYRSTNESTYRRSLKMLKSIQKKRLAQEALRPRLIKPKIADEC
jgi:hypothetical protein